MFIDMNETERDVVQKLYQIRSEIAKIKHAKQFAVNKEGVFVRFEMRHDLLEALDYAIARIAGVVH